MFAMLLGRRDMIPDSRDKYGQTPLWYATAGGHEGVVKILLERRDVDPNKPDYDGRTPFWCAARRGHARVVELLRPLLPVPGY